MKKLVFAALIVMLALTIITCDSFTTPQDKEIGLTDVVYSADGSSVTLYLEGGAPQTDENRALTLDLAKRGHDYFEVVFLSGTDYSRAAWEVGEAAAVKNVPRGVDYGTANPASAGSAILFVGRKSDEMTLLAVGLLTNADGGGGTTEITTATTRVTFTVAALEGGAGFTTASSTFATSSGSIETAVVDGKNYPAYQIDTGADGKAAGATVTGTYTIDSTGTMADYTPGILVVGGGVTKNRSPRVPSAGGGYKYIRTSDCTNLTTALTNNNAAGAFTPAITFTITTTAGQLGFSSVAFDIPVNALTTSISIAGMPAPIEWHIRPGFGSDFYCLDDGAGGAGGLLLLAVGNVTLNSIEVYYSGL